MNEVTKWFSNDIYLWTDDRDFSDMGEILRYACTKDRVNAVLSEFDNIVLKEINYYPAGTYEMAMFIDGKLADSFSFELIK